MGSDRPQHRGGCQISDAIEQAKKSEEESGGIPYHEGYGSVNNDAHRQAADLVGAPAFIWHQALWKSVHGEVDLEERAKTIGSFIDDVHARIRKIKIPGSELHTPDDIKVSHEERAKVISFSFIWADMRTRIRFEIHTEYITITSFIDASIKNVETPTSELGKDVQKHLSAFISGTVQRRMTFRHNFQINKKYMNSFIMIFGTYTSFQRF